MTADLEQRTGSGFDGTRLRYWIRRREPRWLLICTGYGGTLPAWQALLEAFCSDWSLLIWDYRGQFGSDAPPGDTPIQISDHSRDLEQLLGSEGINQGVILGWSIGVQVALEHYRRRPEHILALVLINGAYEKVLHSPLGSGLGAQIVRSTTRGLATVSGTVQPLMKPLFTNPLLARTASMLGVVKGNVEGFSAAAAAWQDLDLRRYLRMIVQADEHITSDMLDTVEIPTLITYGDKDVITPPDLARRLHERIIGSELLLIPDTTHYSIIERPDFVAQHVEEFLRRKLAVGPGECA